MQNIEYTYCCLLWSLYDIPRLLSMCR